MVNGSDGMDKRTNKIEKKELIRWSVGMPITCVLLRFQVS